MMKTMKILGIVAIAAIIGFAMVSCGDDEDCAHEWEKVNATEPLRGATGMRESSDINEKCTKCDETRVVRNPRIALTSDLVGSWIGTTTPGTGQKLTINNDFFKLLLSNGNVAIDIEIANGKDGPLQSDGTPSFEGKGWENVTTGGSTTHASGYRIHGKTLTKADGWSDADKVTLYFNSDKSEFVIKWEAETNLGTTIFKRDE